MTKQEKTAIIAISANAFLTISKFILAYLSGSLALLAEAFHSLTDIGTSSLVFVAVHSEARKDPSKDPASIPWWKRNPQQKVSIAIGVFLLIVSVSMFREVFKSQPLGVKHPVPVAIAVLVFAFISFLLSRLEMSVGKSTSSTALVADGHHTHVDMLASLLVAAALFGESLSWSVDRLAAGIISFFILLHAFEVFAAVLQEMKRKEAAGEYSIPGWATLLTRENIVKAYNGLLKFVARARGWSADDEAGLARAARFLRWSILFLFVVAYIASGVFTLKPSERAVIERFGKPLSENSIGPGLHYHLPWPVERVRRVDATTVRRLVIGSEISPESKVLLWTNIHYIQEYNILTGEDILMDAGMSVHYRIKDVYAYFYNVANPVALLKSAAYSVAFETMARQRFFDIITEGRDKLEREIKASIISTMKPFNTGIEIVNVTLRDLHPPTAVAADFEDVVSATIDFNKYISEADGYRNDLIPKAEGESESRVIKAEAKKTKLVLKAAGEAARFLDNLKGYKMSSVIMKTRYYLETLEVALSGKEKYIIPTSNTQEGSIELFLLGESARGLKKGRRASSSP